MKAVIVEDEAIASRRLASLIGELAPEMEIVGQVTSVENGNRWFAENNMPDLIFLDIQLNDGYGFDILDGLEDHPPVIFTTAYNEYAIRGFKYNGIDYLLKPIDRNDLRDALYKFRKNSVVAPTETDKIAELKRLFAKLTREIFLNFTDYIKY